VQRRRNLAVVLSRRYMELVTSGNLVGRDKIRAYFVPPHATSPPIPAHDHHYHRVSDSGSRDMISYQGSGRYRVWMLPISP
jgi:hypothetical protein